VIISGLLLYGCKYTYLQPSAFYLGLSIMLSAEVNARVPDFARGVLQDFPRHSLAPQRLESMNRSSGGRLVVTDMVIEKVYIRSGAGCTLTG